MDNARIPPTGGSSTGATKSRLYQLPDGNWIVPSTILGIFAVPPQPSLHALVRPIGPHVAIRTNYEGEPHLIYFSTFEEAVVARNKIACDISKRQ